MYIEDMGGKGTMVHNLPPEDRGVLVGPILTVFSLYS